MPLAAQVQRVKRAAPVCRVTGWRSRESLSAARRGDYSHGILPFQKITLSVHPATFPSTSWCCSQSNVRRVKAGVSIDQLAESIAQARCYKA